MQNWPLLSLLIWLPIFGGAAVLALGDKRASGARWLSLAAKMDEIDRTDRVLQAFDGVRHHGVRPPSGAFSLALTLRLARERRRLLYWSYDSLDYQRRPPAELVAAMRARPPRPGDVMLMSSNAIERVRTGAMRTFADCFFVRRKRGDG